MICANCGGYQLKKPAEICFVGDILRVTEGELLSVDESNYKSDRKIAFVLEYLRNTLNQYADSISLQDIIQYKIFLKSYPTFQI